MSHELRTPLNAIIGFTGTLLMRLPGGLTLEQDKQLRTVQSSARHLLSLINDLLDLAKIESGKGELRLEPKDCRALMAEVATTLRPLAEAKGLRLEVLLPEAARVIRTDQRALRQIILNLAGNAVKFTDQGSVTIALEQSVENEGISTDITITDTGPGIRAEDQPRLFEAFAQIGVGTARRTEGTGLGLHLSQKLAGLLGGSIVFESESGQGSRFRLLLREREPCPPAS
jgi:protein-histidine pros-kinase